MKPSLEGALIEIPEGYVITEGVNGEVSVGRAKPTQITEQEVARVAAELKRLGLKHYRCTDKGANITICQPLRSEAELRETARLLAGPRAGQFDPWISHELATEPLEPVMRFQLADNDQRLYTVERMTYRGKGGWHSLLWHGEALAELARKYLPRLGRDSLFELV
jgi:hypothetical protein